MTQRVTFKLSSPADKGRAIAMIERAPFGYAVTVGEETRSQEQNRLMWPLIRDMREQDTDMARFTPEQVKLRCLNALDNEMQFLPELEGAGQFVVGQRSSTLSKGDFSNLLEIMFAWGARNGIKWSRKSEETRAAIAIEARSGETARLAPEGTKARAEGIANKGHSA